MNGDRTDVSRQPMGIAAQEPVEQFDNELDVIESVWDGGEDAAVSTPRARIFDVGYDCVDRWSSVVADRTWHARRETTSRPSRIT
jgi:hypothetical protein